MSRERCRLKASSNMAVGKRRAKDRQDEKESKEGIKAKQKGYVRFKNRKYCRRTENVTGGCTEMYIGKKRRKC